MINVTINDGKYSHLHQLDNDADLFDLIEVLKQYEHSAGRLPATALSIEKDDDLQCESCGHVAAEDKIYAWAIDQPQECGVCRFETEEEMTP
ncbi:MAG: hypothetical protein QQN46_02025 [Nitrosopumilus sp.]